MIYKFRVISDEVELFARTVEINADSSFLDLHEAIQASVAYDSTQLSSFYLADKDWTRAEQITLLDMSDGDDSMMLMSEEKLINHLSSVGDNLVYVFDFFNDRAFYVSIAEIKDAEPSVQYPVSVGPIGEAPEQISMGDLVAEMEAMQAEFEKEPQVKDADGFDMDAFNKEFGEDDAMGDNWENLDDLDM